MTSKLLTLFRSLQGQERESDALQHQELPERRSEKELRIPVQQTATLRWVGEDGECKMQSVEVHNVSPNGVGIVSEQLLPVGLGVIVTTHEGEEVKAMVRHCRKDGTAYRLGLALIRYEKRRFDRQLVHKHATLQWTGAGFGKDSSPVEILDETPEGVQVKVARAVPVPTFVRLLYDDWAQFGFTCYCRQYDEKYLVGIHFSRDPYHKDAVAYSS